jgi:tRNA pseudouridine55 synthase
VANGVLLYPKPAGVTSHDVVASVRRRIIEETGQRERVGHAGTLDPFATGLLLILVGAATRMQRFLMALPKTYRTVARLGWRSDTGDLEGTLEQTGRIPPAPFVLPTGDLMQRPPAYSAVKVGGERLYKKARRGELVEGAPRPVHVHRFEELWRRDDRAAFEIECSAGTYVRQLIADLGDAYCLELERTAIGPFQLAGADRERLVPLELALGFLPEVPLGADDARRARNGVRVPGLTVDSSQLTGAQPEFVRLTHDGYLIAIGTPTVDDLIQPSVVIPT